MHNITLIGMAGCGKTTIGKILASRLGYDFVDGDDLIIEKHGPLQPIIDRDGDEGFMKIEEEILSGFSGKKHIISPGGSSVMEPKAIEHLKKISLVVYLEVPYEIIKERLENSNIDTRGIVGLKKMGLKGLFDYRVPLYKKYADLTVNLHDHPTEEAAQIIIDKLNESR